VNNIFVIAPVKRPRDISIFSKETDCKNFYVLHDKFIYGNFSEIEEFIFTAHSNDCKIFVNFNHDISEEDTDLIKRFILFLTYTKIDGIFINSFSVLEAIKYLSLDFEIIADSHFNIHNLSGINFIKNYGKNYRVVLTEEFNSNNVQLLKESTNRKYIVENNNLQWCAKDIISSKALDSVIIKGSFESSEEILEEIKFTENILKNSGKNKKLFDKHGEGSIRQKNPLITEIFNSKRKKSEISKFIKPFKWKHGREKVLPLSEYKKFSIPKINLRLSSFSQIQALEKYIKKNGFNPVYSIEYGEIINPCDLSENSFSELMTKVKNFCDKHYIKFQYSTPHVLPENDFDRVYDEIKDFCLSSNQDYIVVNNLGYFWRLANDKDLENIKVEIGSGVNLLNSMSIRSLDEVKSLTSVDFTTFRDINNIRNCIKHLEDEIPRRKLTVLGNIRVLNQELYTFNFISDKLSKLNIDEKSNNIYAIEDTFSHKIYPFVGDNFGKKHFFKDEILDLCKYINIFEEMGINEFVIDLTASDSQLVSLLITKFLNSLNNDTPTQLPFLTEHLM